MIIVIIFAYARCFEEKTRDDDSRRHINSVSSEITSVANQSSDQSRFSTVDEEDSKTAHEVILPPPTNWNEPIYVPQSAIMIAVDNEYSTSEQMDSERTDDDLVIDKVAEMGSEDDDERPNHKHRSSLLNTSETKI